MLIVFAYFIVVPLEICFNIGIFSNKYIYHQFALYFFLIDFITKFKTGFYDYGSIILDNNQIFKNTIRNDLVPNFFSILTLTLISD